MKPCVMGIGMGTNGKARIGSNHQQDGKHARQMGCKQSICGVACVKPCKRPANVAICG